MWSKSGLFGGNRKVYGTNVIYKLESKKNIFSNQVINYDSTEDRQCCAPFRFYLQTHENFYN